jgi:phosphoenolpyruvate synthase/pyruvate phosphate dikinase
MSTPLVVELAHCTADHHALVGGKACGLALLIGNGFRVPPGFALTTRAYREHVEHNKLVDDLERLMTDCGTYEAQLRASDEIRQLFEHSTPAASVEDAVVQAYERLCMNGDRPLAVRSSATAEDLSAASFAGQQETYLWITGADRVLRHVLRCWASLFTPQAIAYRLQMRTPPSDLAMGVVVQCMVPAEAAGVMLTLDPITGDTSSITIEAAYGLGAVVVNGEVTPDRFVVDKASLSLRSRTIGEKTSAYRFDSAAGAVMMTPVDRPLQNRACVSDDEMLEVARIGLHMEQVTQHAQDIEWAIGPGDEGPREVFMLQARPETIWSQKAGSNQSFAPRA